MRRESSHHSRDDARQSDLSEPTSKQSTEDQEVSDYLVKTRAGL